MSFSSDADIKRMNTEMVLVVCTNGIEIPLLLEGMGARESTVFGRHINTGNKYTVMASQIIFSENMTIGEYEERINEAKLAMARGGGIINPFGRKGN